MNPALDGTLGDSEALTDLLVGHLLKEPELDHFPELGGKAVKRREQAAPHLPRLEDAVRAEKRTPRGPLEMSLLGKEPLAFADFRAVVVDAVVPGDRVEPHREVRPRIEPVQLAVDPDDDFLGEFLGFVVLTGEAIGEGEESPPVPADEVVPRGVGIQLTGPERLYGRDVLRIPDVVRFGAGSRAGSRRWRGERRELGQSRETQVSGISGRPAATQAVYQRLAVSRAASVIRAPMSPPSSFHIPSM